MTIVISAVLAVLCAQPVFAQRRPNKAFNTSNGRTTSSAPAGPRVFTLTAPGGGAAANAPGAAHAPAVTTAMIEGAPSDGGRSFIGGGRTAASRGSSGAVRRGGKAFWTGAGRRVDGGGAPTSAEEAPPNYGKPGALIRTTGQQPKYDKAETARTQTTDAGEIVFNTRKGFDVARAPSIQHGPKDTPPPPNPETSGRTYSGGAAANSGSGSRGGGDDGKDNNGSGNNGRKDGDDHDDKGNDKTFADPTGFNDAF